MFAGESYGCGGKYKIAPNAPFNFEIGSEKLYKPSMDCQWVISTNKSDVIRLEFNSFHIAPCENVNRINRCDCDFIEVLSSFNFFIDSRNDSFDFCIGEGWFHIYRHFDRKVLWSRFA